MSDVLRQVALERRTERGVQADVAWIDPTLARRGKRVRIEETGEIWTVVEVFGERRREYVDANRPARKHMTEVTGDQGDT